MGVIEIIGLVLIVLAFVAPAIRRILEERKARKDPEGYARRQAEVKAKAENLVRRQLEAFLGQTADDEALEEEAVPVTVPPRREETGTLVSLATQRLSSEVGERSFESEMTERHLVSEVEMRPSPGLLAVWPMQEVPEVRRGRPRIHSLLRQKGGLQQMVLLHELFWRPVSERNPLAENLWEQPH